MMISGSIDFLLFLWNMSKYQYETAIDGVGCYSSNSLYQVDSNRVIVGGKNNYSIVNIDKCVIETTINDFSFGIVRCFTKLRDNRTILCGCEYGIFCAYDIDTEDTEQYTIKKNNHDISNQQ